MKVEFTIKFMSRMHKQHIDEKFCSHANATKWSNTFKQFVGNLPTNCLSVFGHFVGLALKGLNV